jgi:ABC-type multidrug transport system ATPase subunit
MSSYLYPSTTSGVNGAGKSSTLNVLTGDIAPTGGEIFVAGRPLSDPRTRIAIGYCPQTDPLFDLMTARETLWFYGRIRGIGKDLLHRKVEELVKQVGLTKFAHRCSGTYSGGNKRKLSLAISLIGSPRVLLLDEPSSGDATIRVRRRTCYVGLQPCFKKIKLDEIYRLCPI